MNRSHATRSQTPGVRATLRAILAASALGATGCSSSMRFELERYNLDAIPAERFTRVSPAAAVSRTIADQIATVSEFREDLRDYRRFLLAVNVTLAGYGPIDEWASELRTAFGDDDAATGEAERLTNDAEGFDPLGGADDRGRFVTEDRLSGRALLPGEITEGFREQIRVEFEDAELWCTAALRALGLAARRHARGDLAPAVRLRPAIASLAVEFDETVEASSDRERLKTLRRLAMYEPRAIAANLKATVCVSDPACLEVAGRRDALLLNGLDGLRLRIAMTAELYRASGLDTPAPLVELADAAAASRLDEIRTTFDRADTNAANLMIENAAAGFDSDPSATAIPPDPETDNNQTVLVATLGNLVTRDSASFTDRYVETEAPRAGSAFRAKVREVLPILTRELTAWGGRASVVNALRTNDDIQRATPARASTSGQAYFDALSEMLGSPVFGSGIIDRPASGSLTGDDRPLATDGIQRNHRTFQDLSDPVWGLITEQPKHWKKAGNSVGVHAFFSDAQFVLVFEEGLDAKWRRISIQPEQLIEQTGRVSARVAQVALTVLEAAAGGAGLPIPLSRLAGTPKTGAAEPPTGNTTLGTVRRETGAINAANDQLEASLEQIAGFAERRTAEAAQLARAALDAELKEATRRSAAGEPVRRTVEQVRADLDAANRSNAEAIRFLPDADTEALRQSMIQQLERLSELVEIQSNDLDPAD
ncbi:MAG: hypothetical protein AAF108_02115 [Planctomycetota bacterium]